MLVAGALGEGVVAAPTAPTKGADTDTVVRPDAAAAAFANELSKDELGGVGRAEDPGDGEALVLDPPPADAAELPRLVSRACSDGSTARSAPPTLHATTCIDTDVDIPLLPPWRPRRSPPAAAPTCEQVPPLVFTGSVAAMASRGDAAAPVLETASIITVESGTPR